MSKARTVNLSRQQLEQVLMFMRLHGNVHTVIIKQNNSNGIGIATVARFYSGESSNFHEIDITDVGNW